ncbi:MAG: BON domain-containing protein [Thermoanaerobaculia bacterium]
MPPRSSGPRGYTRPYDQWEPEEYVFYEGEGYHRGFFEPFQEPRSQEDAARRGGYAGRGPRNYRRSDERIREDVCERLEEAGHVDASDIEVRVENGEVTLEGTVKSRREKRLAEDLAAEVRGVRDVQNALRVAAQAATREAAADVQVQGTDSHSGSGFLTDRGSERSRRAAGPPGNRAG